MHGQLFRLRQMVHSLFLCTLIFLNKKSSFGLSYLFFGISGKDSIEQPLKMFEVNHFYHHVIAVTAGRLIFFATKTTRGRKLSLKHASGGACEF